MIKKFEVEVERVDRYTIEVDTDIVTEEWMEKFRQNHYEFDDIEAHAAHIAQLRARFANGNIYGVNADGYGDIPLYGEVNPKSSHPFLGINIVKAEEDQEVETNVREKV